MKFGELQAIRVKRTSKGKREIMIRPIFLIVIFHYSVIMLLGYLTIII